MRYLLDANAVITLLNDPTSKLAKHARRFRPGDIGLSAVVAHELFFGAFKSRRAAQNIALVDALPFLVVEFGKEDARCAGELRALLAGRGTPIGPYDVLIAGQAVARSLALVTRNASEFKRVPGLKLENWQD